MNFVKLKLNFYKIFCEMTLLADKMSIRADGFWDDLEDFATSILEDQTKPTTE